jgi:hypothetical protein
MEIGEIIGPARVIVGLRAADKARLVQELAFNVATSLSLGFPNDP